MRYQVAHPRTTFAALSLIFFVISAGAFSSLGVVLPEMVSELHWSWTEAGWGYTCLGLACGLASFIPAILIRRIGVRGDMIVGTLCMIAGFAAMAIAHSVWLYLLATILIGLAFALVSTVPGTHVLNDIFEKRSTALGIYFTVGALGGVVGPVFYTNRLNIGVYDLTHNWRLFWVAFAILAIAAGLFAIVAAPKKHDESQHKTLPPEQVSPGEMIEGLKDWTVWHALATSQFYVVVAGYTAYLLINTTAHGFAVEHLKENGVPAKDGAMMLALEAAFGCRYIRHRWCGRREILREDDDDRLARCTHGRYGGLGLCPWLAADVGLCRGRGHRLRSVVHRLDRLALQLFRQKAEPRTLFDHVLHQHVGSVRSALRRMGARHAGKLLRHVPAMCGDRRSDPAGHYLHAAAGTCRTRSSF